MNILYIPALKAKMGELQALSDLKAEDKKLIKPILEVPEIAWDYVDEELSKSVEKHLESVTKLISKNWSGQPFFLDFLPNIEIALTADDQTSFEFFESLNDAKSLKYVPVIGFDRNEVYLSKVIASAKAKKTGVCLRVQYDNFEDIYDEDAYTAFLKQHQLKPSDIDLIIDLSSVCKETGRTVYLALRLIMSMIPNIKDWRSLTVIASSFPENLRGMKGDSVEVLPRVEWVAWKTMFDKKGKLPRLPTFGDYSIAHPEFIEVDPRMINMSAAIRYSTETDWVVFKGKSVRMEGFQQFKQLSNKLISSEYFKGPDLSKGDADIYKYATDPESGTGSATTWRKIGNNHHFALVLTQLQQLPK